MSYVLHYCSEFLFRKLRQTCHLHGADSTELKAVKISGANLPPRPQWLARFEAQFPHTNVQVPPRPVRMYCRIA